MTNRRDEYHQLELHGRISGDWVGVLDRHWRGILAANPGARFTVELSNVTFIDRNGERLLRQMVRCGVGLSGAGLMSRYVIQTVAAGV